LLNCFFEDSGLLCWSTLYIAVCRHYKMEAAVMLEENWRVRLEELSFNSLEKRGMTRAGSRASLYRVSVSNHAGYLLWYATIQAPIWRRTELTATVRLAGA